MPPLPLMNLIKRNSILAFALCSLPLLPNCKPTPTGAPTKSTKTVEHEDISITAEMDSRTYIGSPLLLRVKIANRSSKPVFLTQTPNIAYLGLSVTDSRGASPKLTEKGKTEVNQTEYIQRPTRFEGIVPGASLEKEIDLTDYYVFHGDSYSLSASIRFNETGSPFDIIVKGVKFEVEP